MIVVEPRGDDEPDSVCLIYEVVCLQVKFRSPLFLELVLLLLLLWLFLVVLLMVIIVPYLFFITLHIISSALFSLSLNLSSFFSLVPPHPPSISSQSHPPPLTLAPSLRAPHSRRRTYSNLSHFLSLISFNFSVVLTLLSPPPPAHAPPSSSST